MGLIKNLTITSSGPGIIAQELFDVLPGLTSSIKKINLPDDPVALAMGSYREWKENGYRWFDLTNVKPTENDRRNAESLKSYYRERMVFEALKRVANIQTSEFRKKLGLLVNNELDITSSEIGLLMRLPYFYEEDQAVDNVMIQTKAATSYLRAEEITATFALHSRVLRSRRQGDFYDYWMTSDHSPTAYRFVLKHDNTLRLLVESLLSSPRQLKASLYTQHMRGYWRGRPYYHITFTGLA